MGFLKKLGQSIVKNPVGTYFAGSQAALDVVTGKNPMNRPYNQAMAAGGAVAMGGYAMGAYGGAGAAAGGAGAAGAAGGGAMSPWIPGAMAGAGAIGNYFSQQEANRANQRIAREQMAFQERMSNTAHQREVDDLRKAGLNPNISAGGNGSSTPSGASADMKAPIIDMPAIMQAVSLEQSQQTINQNQQRINLDAASTAAKISKTADEQDVLKMKRVLMNKGIIRAETEGEVSKILKDMIRNFREKYENRPGTKPKPFIDNRR